jgi:hypothetical protein
MIGSAVMNNVRQIHRYQVDQKRLNQKEKSVQKDTKRIHQQTIISFFVSLWIRSRCHLRSLIPFQPVLGYGF